MLKSSITKENLGKYVLRQLDMFYPDQQEADAVAVSDSLDGAWESMDFCFKHIRRSYFFDGQNVCFDHLNSDQYAMFLYWFARTAKLLGDLVLAKKAYCLNKALHGIDVFYDVKLPKIFMFRHCVGTVLGRAEYGDYFSVGQNCTVGNDLGKYPEIGEGVGLLPGAIVIGKSVLNNNVFVAPGVQVRNTVVPKDTLVARGSNGNVFKALQRSVKERYFNSVAFFDRDEEFLRERQ